MKPLRPVLFTVASRTCPCRKTEVVGVDLMQIGSASIDIQRHYF